MHFCSTFQQRNQTFSRYVSRYVDRRTAYIQFLMVDCSEQGKENELGETRIRFKISFSTVGKRAHLDILASLT